MARVKGGDACLRAGREASGRMDSRSDMNAGNQN